MADAMPGLRTESFLCVPRWRAAVRGCPRLVEAVVTGLSLAWDLLALPGLLVATHAIPSTWGGRAVLGVAYLWAITQTYWLTHRRERDRKRQTEAASDELVCQFIAGRSVGLAKVDATSWLVIPSARPARHLHVWAGSWGIAAEPEVTLDRLGDLRLLMRAPVGKMPPVGDFKAWFLQGAQGSYRM